MRYSAYASIEIAGEIKAVADYTRLVEALVSDRPDDRDMGFPVLEESEAHAVILAAAENARLLDLDDCEARGGEFDSIEAVCSEIGLWFCRHTEADYQVSAEDVTYNPGTKDRSQEYDSGHGHFVLIDVAMKILNDDGADALAEYMHKREKESELASGEGMPGALVLSEAVLAHAKAHATKEAA